MSLKTPTCGPIGGTHIICLASEKGDPLKENFLKSSVVGKPLKGEGTIGEGNILDEELESSSESNKIQTHETIRQEKMGDE